MKNTILLTFIITVFIYGCNSSDDSAIEPKKDILGKWELIQQGTSLENLFDLEPAGYTEFLSESSYRDFDYITEKFNDGDYTLNDSLLIYYYYAINQHDIDTVSVRYYYRFKNSKTLILDIDASAIFRTFIYKKIN
tara:strand:+ start:421 stop:828 length:408 start_codon:yes stop_codon:yes gene_type:complete